MKTRTFILTGSYASDVAEDQELNLQKQINYIEQKYPFKIVGMGIDLANLRAWITVNEGTLQVANMAKA